MKKTAKHSIVAILAATLGLCASLAHAQTTNSVYVIDGRGQVATDPYGLCWRTGFWTPAAAATDPNGCKCDKDLIPKEVCEPKAAAAAAPAGAAATKPAGEKVTVAADALFDFNKSTLRPEGKQKLDEVAAKADKLVLEVVIAVGHADRIGSAAYNQKLSEKRAASVKDYLVSKGIPANKIYTEGKGKRNPVTTGCNQKNRKQLIACLQPHRRVEVEVKGEIVVRK